MWPDNETDLDLLGFDELVDELVVALTTPRLLPLTVGILGDWGSGKSSLLQITRRELESEKDDEGRQRYLCVSFSPWLYEDYDDVKTALMGEVLRVCRTRAITPEVQEQAEKLGRFSKGLRGRGRLAGRAAVLAVPAAVPAVLAALDPSLADTSVAAVEGGAKAVAPVLAQVLADKPTTEATAADGSDEITDLPSFRREFAGLVASLEGVEAVVVLIDDLDRCLPETIVDTFEAIRLFLNAPQTAFVVAASRAIVESAIDSRYPTLKREDGRGIGHDYLEKMLQLQVSVPPLSTGQTESYINLLIAQLNLAPENFQELCQSLRERRTGDAFTPTFNAAMARAALGEQITADIERDLGWTAEMSTALNFLRGNPRQIKRFLNELTWRRRAAERRGVDLRHDVLAKLMVLEEQSIEDFQTLFDWQLQADGPSPQLAAAEKLAQDPEASSPAPAEAAASESAPPARGGRRPARVDVDQRDAKAPSADPVAEAAASWVARAKANAWLRLAPELATVDLRPYFSYFRDRLVVGSAAATLRPELQILLGGLTSDVSAMSRDALGACEKLGLTDQGLVTTALMDAVLRRPDGPALLPACELAARVPHVAGTVCGGLASIPHPSLPRMQIPSIMARLKSTPGAADLLVGWSASPVTEVARAAGVVMRARSGG